MEATERWRHKKKLTKNEETKGDKKGKGEKDDCESDRKERV